MDRRRFHSLSPARDWSRRLRATVAFFALLASASVVGANDAPRHVLNAGPVEVVVEPWPRGVRIAAGSVPVSVGSELLVRRAADGPLLLALPDERAVREARREEFDGGVRLHMAYRDAAGTLTGEDMITVHNDGRVERELSLHSSAAAGDLSIECLLAALHPPPLVGRSFTPTGADGPGAAESIPIAPARSDTSDGALARNFSRLEFDSRMGPVRVDVESDRTVTLVDPRGRLDANAARAAFRIVDADGRLPSETRVRYRVTFHLPATAGQVETLPLTRSNSTVRPRADAQTWPTEPPTIVPRPKLITWGTGGFALPEPLPARLFDMPTEAPAFDSERPAIEFARYVRERLGIGTSATRTGAEGFITIRLPVEADFPLEGYRLRVDESAVVIEARSESGLLHAVQTLKQLLTRTPEGPALLRAVDIYDWPTLAFRGAVLPGGGQSSTLHMKLLRDVIAAMKMNQLVLIADYVKWDAVPELHHPAWGMPKPDVRQILDLARSLDVEVTPLIHTLTHADWMFTNGHHLELAEDPATRDVLCVTHPDAGSLLTPILSEAIELFRPRALNIGHGDYLGRERNTWRETTRKRAAAELWQESVRRNHELLKQHGVRTMFWGDALLAPGESVDAAGAKDADDAAKRRAALPADVLVVDRQTRAAPPAEYTSLATLASTGREVVAAPGSAPANIVSLAKAAFETKVRGLLLTTSAGPALDESSFERDLSQHASLALAAEAAWNADVPVNAERFLQGAHFAELSGLSTLRPANRAGWTASIAGVANFPLGARTGGGWFGLGGRHDLSALPFGVSRLHGVMFDIARTSLGNLPIGLALASRLDVGVKLPAEAQLDLNARAKTLVFLHTTNFTCEPGTLVGSYEIQFADARPPQKIELRYGHNILAYTDLSAAPAAPILWTGATPGNQRVALRGLVWNNPEESAPIANIVVRGGGAAASLVLVGVTGLEDEARTPRTDKDD